LLATSHPNEKVSNTKAYTSADAVPARAIDDSRPYDDQRYGTAPMGLPGNFFLSYLAVRIGIAPVWFWVHGARFVELVARS
jgi:hypothetical protein